MKKHIVYVICLSLLLSFSFNAEVLAYSAYGSSGKEVVAIQKQLSSLGYYHLKCDGVYGRATEQAVKKFQQARGLDVDGIAGRKTLMLLKVVNQKELELLAAVINGEARGESFEGQVAVGAVVINRIEHPAFPDTLTDVVYQKGAFTAVIDGQINLKINESCKKAALAALTGDDPTGGAVYYYNPKTATCKWIRTRNVVKKIGNHLFCI